MQRARGAGVIAAQHVGETLVVENLRRRADQADRLRIGAVGEIETAQPVVRRGEADPGFGVARILFGGGAEALFGVAEVVVAEIALAVPHVVVRIVAGVARDRERPRRQGVIDFGRLGDDRAGGLGGLRRRGRLASFVELVQIFPRRAGGEPAKARCQHSQDKRTSGTHHALLATRCGRLRAGREPAPLAYSWYRFRHSTGRLSIRRRWLRNLNAASAPAIAGAERASAIVLAMRCIRGFGHGTGTKDAGRDRVTPKFLRPSGRTGFGSIKLGARPGLRSAIRESEL